MDKKCPRCSLNNRNGSRSCARCLLDLNDVVPEPAVGPEHEVGSEPDPETPSLASRLIRRMVVCLVIAVVTVSGFYLSLILSARPLTAEERAHVEDAIEILEQAGFDREVYYLRHYTSFRGNDNWLNSIVAKENAYAATNYPFEIMTVYPDFFVYSTDNVERAAILLHESRHLQGFDEKDAYSFVWKNKARFGWSKAKYGHSVVWRNVRNQTREVNPKLFICEFNDFGDCYQ